MRKLLLALTALVLCLYPVVGASSPPSGGNFGGVGSYPETYILNINNRDDPFDYIMSYIVDRLIETGAACVGAGACIGDPDQDTPRIVRIVGSVEVDYTDFYDMGDYRVGLLICAGDGKTGNYPDPYGGGTADGDSFRMDYDGDFIIDFTEAEFIVDQAAAPERLVPIKFGCNYDVGWASEDPDTNTSPGNWLMGLVVKGNPRIEFTTAVEDGTWYAGHIPTINPNNTTHGAKHGSDDSSIGIWEDGLMYSDLTNFNPTLRNIVTDDDNIGYLIGAPGWNVHRGRMDIEGFGVGLYVNGNTVGSTVNGGDFISNDNGIVIGNPYSGNQIEPVVGGTYSKGATFDSARAATVSDIILSNIDIDISTGEYGGLLIYNVSRFTSINSHYETYETADGHLIQIGGGWADRANEGYRPCAFDDDRDDNGALACTEATGGGTSTTSVRFIGGTISGDKDNNNFDALAIGDNFDAPSDLFLETYMGASDIDKTGVAPDLRLFNIDTLDDGAGGNATGKVDITRVRTATNILPPLYRYVVHQGAYIENTMIFDILTTSQCVNFSAKASEVVVSNAQAQIQLPVPLEDSEMGNFWNAAYFGVAAGDLDNAGASMTGCKVDLWADTWLNTIPILAGAALNATSLTIGSNCGGGGCNIGADGESYWMPVMSDIDPGDTTGLCFTDYGGADACNDGAGNLIGSLSVVYFPRLDR